MTERSAIHQTVQIGVETTHGTRPAGGANKRLLATSITPAIQKSNEPFRPRGYKYPTVVVPGREHVEAGIEGIGAYNDLTYLLASLLGAPTSVQQGGTAAYKHTFSPDSNDVDAVKSFYVEEGGDVRAHAFAYGLVTELGLNISREAVELSGAMIGQLLSDDIEMGINEVQTLTITGSPTGGTFTISYSGQTTTAIAYNATAAQVQAALEALSNIAPGDVVCTGGPLPATAIVIEFAGTLARTNVAAMTTTDSFTGGSTPASAIAQTVAGGEATEIDEAPILPEDISIYMDDTAAALGTTLLTRVLTCNWSLSGRHGPVWPINAANASFATHVETEPEGTVEMTMEADAVGMGLLTPLRSGAKKFVRIQAVGPEIDTGYCYTLTLDLCLVVTEPGEFSDEDGVYAISPTFRVAHDKTWGKAMQVELTNIIVSV
ncbi:MAG: tail protein [Phage 5P_3]|nr:MAG: tail protein [Phage 5P_3]